MFSRQSVNLSSYIYNGRLPSPLTTEREVFDRNSNSGPGSGLLYVVLMYRLVCSKFV